MKKQYYNLELEILALDAQDVITTSVYVEWDNDWKGDGNTTFDDNIFG